MTTASSAHRTHHVRIVYPEDGYCTQGDLIRACARTEAEAIAVAKEQGLTVLHDAEGGQIDVYDAEDGPRIANYRPDGFGVILVTVADLA